MEYATSDFMVTKRQKEVFEYISRFTYEHGYAPTLEEIRGEFSFASISTAHYHIRKLEEAGYLKKGAHKSRAIETKAISFGAMPRIPIPSYLSVPVLGSANCGPAEIFATEEPREYLTIPASSLNRKTSDGLFLLEAVGESMNKARVGSDKQSIDDGDYVLIDSSDNSPAEGDYVLSIIDGCANIKRYTRVDGRIALISESSHKIPPIFVSPGTEFLVNGKVVGVVKNF